jgi:hypothetical protein
MDGTAAGYDGDVNKGPVILGITLGTDIFAGIMVTLRAFVRLRITKGFGRDDICILAAMVSGIQYE